MVYDTQLTETEFLRKFTAVWGEEYVEDLVNRGFLPVLTTEGWKWVQDAKVAVS